MIEIEIDGKVLQAPQGSMIIEIADAHGIHIPRFCYHKKLSVAANCRMCLVEVEKMGKPLPACATPVTPNMKIYTHSAKAKDAQRAVMEFLLINHPLDCPICDQGGQCELQDNSLSYGSDASLYQETKRVVEDKDLGPLIATDLTRCIQCTRCVRFGQEIAGLRELGTVGRGEHVQIRTFVEHSVTSEISGNSIDLCPVGALTSKPFRFTARPWELTQHAGISPHDCLGTNLYLHTRNNEVMRVVPHENEAINETWLADRDRYSYTGLKSADRLLTPMIKTAGTWQETDWQTALDTVTQHLQNIKTQHGAQALAALVSPSCTSEELHLAYQLWQALGSTKIDHRLKALDRRDNLNRDFLSTASIVDLESCDTALLIGANLHQELPLAATRLRKATLQGASIHAINPAAYTYHFAIQNQIATSQMVDSLAGVVLSVLELTQQKLNLGPISHTPTETERGIAADLLKTGQAHKVVVLGQLASHHPAAAQLRSLALLLCHLTQARIFLSTDGANTVGGNIAQRLCTQTTRPYADWYNEAAKAYFLLGLEAELDCANSATLISHLKQAECVVMITPFASNQALEYATVLLPSAAFGETSGSFFNLEGTQQHFAASVTAPGQSRPAWKILRVLGNLLEIPSFDYTSCEDVSHEITQGLAQRPLVRELPKQDVIVSQLQHDPAAAKANNKSLNMFSTWPLYRSDALVRRSLPLQATQTQIAFGLYVNAATAQRWQLNKPLSLTHTLVPVVIDAALPDNSAFVPAGYPHSDALLAHINTLDTADRS